MQWNELDDMQKNKLLRIIEMFWEDHGDDVRSILKNEGNLHERREIIDNTWEDVLMICEVEFEEMGLEEELENEDKGLLSHLEDYFYTEFLKKELGSTAYESLGIIKDSKTGNRWKQ